MGRLTKIETNYPEFLSGLQRFDFNSYGFNEDHRNFLISNKSDVPYPWKQDAFQDLIVKELGYGKTPPEWMKLKNKVSMNMDEWKTFWKNKGKKNDLNSFFSPTSKISYDENEQEMAILNIRRPLEGSSPSPHVVEKDFFGKNRINNKDDQFGPFSESKDKKDTYKIWSGLEILKPHSLPAKDWNR